MADLDFKALARLGAHARLAELVAEMDSILEAFPDLGSVPARPRKTARGGGNEPGPLATQPEGREPKARRRRRGKMTAAQRKEVSRRMKRYWAERRQAKGK